MHLFSDISLHVYDQCLSTGRHGGGSGRRSVMADVVSDAKGGTDTLAALQ